MKCLGYDHMWADMRSLVINVPPLLSLQSQYLYIHDQGALIFACLALDELVEQETFTIPWFAFLWSKNIFVHKNITSKIFPFDIII